MWTIFGDRFNLGTFSVFLTFQLNACNTNLSCSLLLSKNFFKVVVFFGSFYIFASAILQENMLMNYSATRMSVSERKKEIPFLLFYKLWCISHVYHNLFGLLSGPIDEVSRRLAWFIDSCCYVLYKVGSAGRHHSFWSESFMHISCLFLPMTMLYIPRINLYYNNNEVLKYYIPRNHSAIISKFLTWKTSHAYKKHKNIISLGLKKIIVRQVWLCHSFNFEFWKIDFLVLSSSPSSCLDDLFLRMEWSFLVNTNSLRYITRYKTVELSEWVIFFNLFS